MEQLVDASALMKTLRLPELQKWKRGEGEVVNPLDLSFTWKVKAKDTGFAFSVYEMEIKPGAFIPIHVHPFAEFFYVLEGQIDVMTLNAEGALKWVPVWAGECANAPATAPHGIKNRSDKPAKFLSVSNFEHQKGFDDYQELLSTPEGASLSEDEKGEALMSFFADYKIAFLDPKA